MNIFFRISENTHLYFTLVLLVAIKIFIKLSPVNCNCSNADIETQNEIFKYSTDVTYSSNMKTKVFIFFYIL